jgi:hypothetical protein
VRHVGGAIRVLLGEADPVDGQVARRNLAAKKADPPTPDDGKPDTIGCLRAHALPHVAAIATEPRYM